MSFESEIAADFAELASERGVSCAFQNLTFTALASRCKASEVLALGGLVESPDLTLKALRATFTSGFPEIGDRISVAGDGYRVCNVSSHPRSALLLLTLTTDE